MASDGVENSLEFQSLRQQLYRKTEHLNCALKWLELLELGTALTPYFEARECHRIGIYGMAEFGKLLQKELKRSSGIETVYFMDRNAEKCRKVDNIPVFLPEELLEAPEVDMIVVTAFVAFSSISESLLKMKPEIPVVSLKSILDIRMVEEWDGK